MSATKPNFDSVWKILEEVSLSQMEFKTSQKELQTFQKEFQVSQKELQTFQKEFQVSQKELQDSQKVLQASQIKTDIQLAKTDAKLKKLGEMYGGVSNNQGDVAEEFYFNTLKANPELKGLRFDYIEKNVTRSHNKLEDEFDILMVNGSDVFIIEVKYKAHKRDLERLLNKKAVNFKKLYPEFSGYQHHLGLATFHINDELREEALNKGVTVLQRKGKIIETWAA